MSNRFTLTELYLIRGAVEYEKKLIESNSDKENIYLKRFKELPMGKVMTEAVNLIIEDYYHTEG